MTAQHTRFIYDRERGFLIDFMKQGTPDHISNRLLPRAIEPFAINPKLVAIWLSVQSKLNNAYKRDCERRFKKLVEEWKSSRRPSSSAKILAEHPAYLEIISMGKVAIPLILKELESKPDHWFVALYKLTGENPVPEESHGKIREMAEAWISWGKQKGYI